MVQDFITQRNTYFNTVAINTNSFSSPVFYVEANALASAHRSDGNGRGITPEGLRFRLDPNLNIDSLQIHPIAKIITKAGQKYGFVVWDTAGAHSLGKTRPISGSFQWNSKL